MEFYRKWIKENPIKWFPLFLVGLYLFAFITQTAYDSEWRDWAKFPTVIIAACGAFFSIGALIINVIFTIEWVQEKIKEDKRKSEW